MRLERLSRFDQRLYLAASSDPARGLVALDNSERL
jgi:hypothetical protein